MATIKEIAEIVGVSGAVTVTLTQACLLWMSENGLSGEYSIYLSPPLTTIHIDIPCICETALDLLRTRVLSGGRVTKLVFVNGIPVFRKSC